MNAPSILAVTLHRVRAALPLRRLTAVVAALAALATVFTVARDERGLTSLTTRLSAGSAWLVAQNGTAALVDGLSGRRVVRVTATTDPAHVDRLHVVQAGPDGYVVNRADGTVMRLDGTTLRPGAPTRFSPGGDDAGLELYIGSDTGYVVSGTEHTVRRVDLTTLAPIDGEERSFTGQLDATVVTPDGSLYTATPGTGTVTIYRPQRPPVQTTGLELDPEARLVVVGDRPVLVEPSRQHVVLLDGSGRPAGRRCFQIPPADTRVSGASGSPWVSAVAGNGRLYLADMTTDTCLSPVVLDAGESRSAYGPPVESDGLIYVPDLTTGQVVIVDPSAPTPTIRRTEVVVSAGNTFRVFRDDDLVWYDDDAGGAAGIVNDDGTIRVSAKFDPAEETSEGIAATVDPDDISSGGKGEAGKGNEPDPGTRSGSQSGGGKPDPGSGNSGEQSGSGSGGAGGGASNGGSDQGGGEDPAPKPPPPELSPDFEVVAGRIVVGRPALFAEGSRGPAAKWEWFLQGSDKRAGEGRTFTHTFDEVGPITVSLRITDAAGRSATESKDLVVEPGEVDPRVPPLVGKSVAQARALLITAGYSVGRVTEVASDQPKDVVVAARPGEGEVRPAGTAVDLDVSKGPAKVVILAVAGNDCSAAQRLLENLPVKVRTVDQAGAGLTNLTAAQAVGTEPVARTEVDRNTEVNLTCRTLPAMPTVVGLPADQAEQELKNAGFLVPIVRTAVDDRRPANEVIGQTPEPGQPTDPATASVTLRVSKGPGPVSPVPDVCSGHISETAAGQLIAAAGFTVGPTRREASGSVSKHNVIRTDPACGTDQPDGSTVVMTVSSGPTGPPDVVVPAICGGTVAEADGKATLEREGFTVAPSPTENHPSVPAGNVIRTSPACGSVGPLGSTVTVIVSRGAKVTIPAICSGAVSEADGRHQLENAGLAVVVEHRSTSATSAGNVITTEPACGQTVDRGAQVRMIVAQPDMVAVPDCTGRTLDAVKADLANLGLVYQDGGSRHDAVAPNGQCLSTNPTSRSTVPPNSTVTVVTSLGPEVSPQVEPTVAISCVQGPTGGNDRATCTATPSTNAADGAVTSYRWTVSGTSTTHQPNAGQPYVHSLDTGTRNTLVILANANLPFDDTAGFATGSGPTSFTVEVVATFANGKSATARRSYVYTHCN